MVARRPVTEGLNISFTRLMVSGDREKMEDPGYVMTGWKDLPMELLLRILSMVYPSIEANTKGRPISMTDEANYAKAVIAASGVCTSWREALCLGITSLPLSWCKNNMNSLVQSLAPKLIKLQVLDLRQNDRYHLEDSAVGAIASHCHDLRELKLSKGLNLSDHSLYVLANGCPRLTILNISGCVTFSESALAYLTAHCRNLKFLNLCGCVDAATDRSLQAISYNCSKLQNLNLGWCEYVTDEGVTSLAGGCPDLRALNLCGCIRITDESVIALASCCPHLRSLGLYFCQNITDRAMYSLANSGVGGGGRDRGLVNLNIGQCTALTPPAVQAVCDSFPGLHTCPGLHSLDISGCISLASVHCACSLHGRTAMANHAY